MLQAITSVQEMTLSQIPKMLAVAAVLLLLAPWMLEMMTDFATPGLGVHPPRLAVSTDVGHPL